ncbi:MAG: hypothetical protein EHM93_06785 [Bacteroidales bacterium]|nr:MAG: hypothetical protein EHM93_06785 [Bacteroidales bacterium]
MKTTHNDRALVNFSSPDPITNHIVVSRVLPDHSVEPIGIIYPDFGNEEISAMYASTDNQGAMLFPPTSDFIDLENRFERYAKELAEKSFMEDMNRKANEFGGREESIKGLRRFKLNLEVKLLSR